MQDSNFNQEENLANWIDGVDDLPAFSMLPDPNEEFGDAEAHYARGGTQTVSKFGYISASFETSASTNTWENETTSYPIALVDSGKANSNGSFQIQTPHVDGQNVSTRLIVCNDIHNKKYGETLLLDSNLFSNAVTPFPGQDPIGFNHWDDVQLETSSTTLNFGSTLQQNAIGSTDLVYTGCNMGEKSSIYPVGINHPMRFPTETPTGFYSIPASPVMDLNAQHTSGLIAQTSTASLADNFNFGAISANLQMPVKASASQATAAQVNPPPLPTTSTRPLLRCSIPWCPVIFKRKHEQVRHEASVHGINQGIHRCQVIGCPNYGRGFSRKDKLTEHMWKKHANLGYTKRVL